MLFPKVLKIFGNFQSLTINGVCQNTKSHKPAVAALALQPARSRTPYYPCAGFGSALPAELLRFLQHQGLRFPGDSRVKRERLRLRDREFFEVRVGGVDEVIAFARYNGAGYAEHGAPTGADPFVAQFLGSGEIRGAVQSEGRVAGVSERTSWLGVLMLKNRKGCDGRFTGT